MVEEHSAIDPTFVEDLLLTFKTFLDRPSEICSQLLNWFLERRFRDKVRLRRICFFHPYSLPSCIPLACVVDVIQPFSNVCEAALICLFWTGRSPTDSTNWWNCIWNFPLTWLANHGAYSNPAVHRWWPRTGISALFRRRTSPEIKLRLWRRPSYHWCGNSWELPALLLPIMQTTSLNTAPSLAFPTVSCGLILLMPPLVLLPRPPSLNKAHMHDDLR